MSTDSSSKELYNTISVGSSPTPRTIYKQKLASGARLNEMSPLNIITGCKSIMI